MISAALKQPQNLRKISNDIVLNGSIIAKDAIGYLIGRATPSSPAKVYFISLCEKYNFDVTEVPNDFFKTV